MYAGKNYDWPLIRSLYEKGVGPAAIVRQLEMAPTRQAIAQRAKRENWTQVIVNGNREGVPAQLQQTFAKDTPETRAQIIDLIRSGVSEGVAAQSVGIHRNTLSNWKGACPEFCAAIDAARAAFIGKHQSNIDKAGDRDWRASAYLLERQSETRETYAPNAQGTSGITVVLNIHRDEERDALEGEYERLD